jgi:hypothetical protein
MVDASLAVVTPVAHLVQFMLELAAALNSPFGQAAACPALK